MICKEILTKMILEQLKRVVEWSATMDAIQQYILRQQFAVVNFAIYDATTFIYQVATYVPFLLWKNSLFDCME